MRLWAENLWKRVREAREVAAAQLESLLGEHHDRPALRRLVRERRELGDVGELLLRDARGRMERRGLAVAERDGAGLVEQQHVDVAGRLDRAPGGGDDVGPHHPVHARDADGGQQAADRGRDQADEQRHQHARSTTSSPPPEASTANAENGASVAVASRNTSVSIASRIDSAISLGVSAAPGAFDHRDHAIEEGLARIARDAHDQPVRQHAGTPGDRREVAAGLAQHGRRLAGDRALVDGGYAFDHLAVGGNGLPGLDEEEVALAQAVGRHDIAAARSTTVIEPLRLDLATRRAQCSGLGLAAALGDGLGEVREQHGEPQPCGDREHEAGAPDRVPGIRGGHETEHGRQHAADVHDEHHRVADLHARIELAECVEDAACG